MLIAFGFVQGKEVRRRLGVLYVTCKAYRGRPYYIEGRADMIKPELVDYDAKSDTYYIRDVAPPAPVEPVEPEKRRKKRFFLF